MVLQLIYILKSFAASAKQKKTTIYHRLWFFKIVIVAYLLFAYIRKSGDP